MKDLIAGTRGSALAQAQTRRVVELLRAIHPGLAVRTEIIHTSGDAAQDQPLSLIGGEGVFTRELGAALRSGNIHLAVHSLKDLPLDPAPGLIIAAVTERENALDVLVCRSGRCLEDLPPGARVGTGSPRRAAQLLALRPDLVVAPIRGNVDTRLRKLANSEYDAVIVAAAGLLRLGLADLATQAFTLDEMLPAPGQGALAIQTRDEDAATIATVAPLQDEATRQATDAERAFLRALGGGCREPVAAYGQVTHAELSLRGLIASEDGREIRRGELTGPTHQADEIGSRLARLLVDQAPEKTRPHVP